MQLLQTHMQSMHRSARGLPRRAGISGVLLAFVCATLVADAGASDSIGAQNPTSHLDRWYLRSTNIYATVRFAGNIFIALGNNGALATSPDGQTWTPQNSGVTTNLTGAAYGPHVSRYVVVGMGGTILVSSNGVNWTKVTSPTPSSLNDVASDGVSFAAAATRNTSGQPNVVYSTQGTTWSPANFPGAETQTLPFSTSKIASGNGVYVAAGGPYTQTMFWGALGWYWVQADYVDQYVLGLTYGNGRFLLGGAEGRPRASINDGANWFVVGGTNVCNYPFGGTTASSCFAANDVAFGNGTFVMARFNYPSSGVPEQLSTSMDTTNWVKRLGGTGVVFNSIAYGKGTFVAVGPNGVFQSLPVATPILSIRSVTGTNTLVLNSAGELGRGYRLQSSTNLTDWSDVLAFTNTSPVMEFSVTPDPALPARLFRAVSP